MRITLALIILCFAGCTDEEAARQTLADQGYTDIRISGHDLFACADSDSTCTEFSAVTSAGRRVTGAVGCGVGCGKACTIRFHR